MTEDPDWLVYERAVHEEVTSCFPDATVTYDARLSGRRSGVERQIDVLIEQRAGSALIRTAIDAKNHGRRIDVKGVEEFLGLLSDVEVDRGVLICPAGYTDAALTRAFRDDVDLDLDILTLEEFKKWQGPGALPYAGDHGVVMPAPLGWVIDADRAPGVLARLYRRGLAFEQALSRSEFMYVNIWQRTPPTDSLDALLAKQERDILAASPGAAITMRSIDVRRGLRGCVRRADIPGYPTAELTGFVEFDGFILFVVLFTPLTVERRNVRKLEHLLSQVIPFNIVRQQGA